MSIDTALFLLKRVIMKYEVTIENEKLFINSDEELLRIVQVGLINNKDFKQITIVRV